MPFLWTKNVTTADVVLNTTCVKQDYHFPQTSGDLPTTYLGEEHHELELGIDVSARASQNAAGGEAGGTPFGRGDRGGEKNAVATRIVNHVTQ